MFREAVMQYSKKNKQNKQTWEQKSYGLFR